VNIKGSRTTATYCDWNLIHQIMGDLVGQKDWKYVLLIAVGIYTGLRISDILQLRWEDLVDKDYLEVHEKKTGKYRRITLHKFLKRMVSMVYAEIEPYKDDHLIFRRIPHPYKSIPIPVINRKFKQIFANYPQHKGNVCSHMLRKTFGRRVWDKNDQSDAALIMLSEMFNHMDTFTTRRYLGIRQEELGDLYRML